jgi:putative DNA primase/helicase
VKTYDYCDEKGELIFQVVRMEPKSFRQRRPKPGGGWDWSVKGVRKVVYRLPELLANPERAVIIVEGEKDVDNLLGLNVLATCSAGGAGKWSEEHTEPLRGRRVFIIPDNDGPGRKHAEDVAKSLAGITKQVKIIELPNLPEKGDVSDWIAGGSTISQLKKIARVSQNCQVLQGASGASQIEKPANGQDYVRVEI